METKPLLSDERLIGYVTVANGVQIMKMNRMTPVEVRDLYEAARAEDAKLIQHLVDALEGACAYARTYDECPYLDGEHALSAAAARNFKPTEQP